jgi:hypothetical protein
MVDCRVSQLHGNLGPVLEASEPVLVADARSGRLLQWNGASARLFGLQPAHAGRLRLGDLLPELAGRRQQVLVKGLTTDGRPLSLDATVTRVEPPTGTALDFVQISQDRRLRHEFETRLRESEERYHALYDKSPNMYFTVGQDGRVRSVNAYGADHLGYLPQELEGGPVTKVFLEEDHPKVERQIADAVAHLGEALRWEIRKIRKDGTIIWVREVARAVHDPVGDVVVLVVCEDITNLKDMEHRLSLQNEQLKHLDRMKNQFVGAVSHELRTPLTTIRGYAEFLEDEVGGPLTADQRGYVEAIYESTLRLQRLVDDLLDFSRLEVGEFKLRLERADLAARLRATTDALMPRARAAGMAIALELPDDRPRIVEMDPQRIAQVVTNLVDNAIKFGGPDTTIRVVLTDLAAAVCVAVADQGPGIAEDDQERIFDRFVQLDGGDDRANSGAGLGLAIARGIVEAHRGQIGVDSVPGEGSRFYFTLPVAPAEPAPRG